MNITRWIVAGLLLGALGCTEPEPEEIPEVAANEESATEEEPEAEREEAEEPAEEPAAAVAEEETDDEVAEVDEADAEGEDAEASADGEGTACEQAYASVMQLRASLVARLGNSASPPPDRGRYLQACSTLPEAAQRCMNVAYSMEHQEECAEHRAAISTARAGTNPGAN